MFIPMPGLSTRRRKYSDVAQISNLLYRRFVIGSVSDAGCPIELDHTLQNTILRYSRLQICATTCRGNCVQAGCSSPRRSSMLLVMRRLKIKRMDLEEAFEMNFSETQYYLNAETGEVLAVQDQYRDALEQKLPGL